MYGKSINNISDRRSEFYFSKGHTWVQKNIYGLIKFGITDYWTIHYGELYIVEIVNTPKVIKADDEIIQLKCGIESIIIPSPLSGVLMFINPNIKGRKIVEPFHEDWIGLIKANDFIQGRAKMVNANVYAKQLNSIH